MFEPLGEAWKEMEEVRFAVAVPVDGQGQPLVDATFPLHVYFPTDEEPDLHVAVHAEWMLSMDRRQIATTPEAVQFNRMLMTDGAIENPKHNYVLPRTAFPALAVPIVPGQVRVIEAIVPRPASADLDEWDYVLGRGSAEFTARF